MIILAWAEWKCATQTNIIHSTVQQPKKKYQTPLLSKGQSPNTQRKKNYEYTITNNQVGNNIKDCDNTNEPAWISCKTNVVHISSCKRYAPILRSSNFNRKSTKYLVENFNLKLQPSIRFPQSLFVCGENWMFNKFEANRCHFAWNVKQSVFHKLHIKLINHLFVY